MSDFVESAIDFRQLGENSSDLIAVFDSQFRYSYVNPATERTLRTSREKLLGRVLWDVTPHVEGTIFAENYRRAMRDRIEIEFEAYYSSLDRWSRVRCFPESGGGLIVFGRETTEQHKAQERERDAAILADLIRQSQDALIVRDAEDIVRDLNPAAELLYGYSNEEARGRNVHELFQNEFTEGIEAYRSSLRFNRQWAGEIVQRRKDGSTVIVSSRQTLRLGSDGEPDIVLASNRDITEKNRAEARLRRLFDSSVVGVIFWNLDTGEITDANDTFLSMVGYSRNDLDEGRLSFRAMTPPEWTERNENGIAAIRSDGFASTYEKEYFRKDGSRVPILIGGTRFEDSPVEGYSYILDITERKDAEARNALLSDASRLLNTSLDYKETLATVAHLLVPKFADWCAVDIVDETGALQRVAVEHVDPAKAAWGWELHRRYPPRLDEDRGMVGVIRTGRPSLTPLVTDEMLVASISDPEHLRLILEVGLTSVIMVPLTVRDTVFGALSLIATRESGRLYSDDDLPFATEIARRAAMAVENARLFQAAQDAEARQRRIADTLQQSMLLAAPEIDAFPGLEIDPYYEAAWDEAMIGGDYSDVFAVDNARVVALVGDCTGKGLNAARFVAECEFMARAFLRENPDPADALRRLNRVLINGQRFDGRPEGALTTLAIVVIDTVTGETIIAAGGSEPPLLLRVDTGQVEEIQIGGALLGADSEALYESRRVMLSPGDVIVMTTDGTTEARNGKTRQFFGYDGLIQTVVESFGSRKTIKGTAEEIVKRAKVFAGGVLSDDACVLVARYTGMTAGAET